jgi:hypothetical protein
VENREWEDGVVQVSEPQLVSSDPNYGAPPVGAHPEARMSAAQPPIAGLAWGTDPNAVTLKDVINDPVTAIKQMGTVMGQEVSDPKLWLGIALSYLGPRAFGIAAPVISKAAGMAARGAVTGAASLGDAVSPDVIGAISPRAGKIVEVAQRMRKAMGPPTASTPAAPSAAPVASAPAAPAPPAVRATPEAAPAPIAASAPSPVGRAPVPATPDEPVIRKGPDGLLVGRPGGNPNLPDQKALNEAAIAARRGGQPTGAPSTPPAPTSPQTPKLNAAETTAFLGLLKRGMSGPEALKNILLQRELVDQLGTPSPTANETRFPKGMRGLATGAQKD